MHCKSISTFVQHRKHLQNHPDLNCTEHLLLKISSTLHFYIGETGIIIISSKFGWYFTTLTNDRHLTFLESDLTVCVPIRPWERDWSSELWFIARNVGLQGSRKQCTIIESWHRMRQNLTREVLASFVYTHAKNCETSRRKTICCNWPCLRFTVSREVNKSLKQWSYLH